MEKQVSSGLALYCVTVTAYHGLHDTRRHLFWPYWRFPFQWYGVSMELEKVIERVVLDKDENNYADDAFTRAQVAVRGGRVTADDFPEFAKSEISLLSFEADIYLNSPAYNPTVAESRLFEIKAYELMLERFNG